MGGLPHSWSKTKGREFGDPLLLAVRPAVRLATEHDRRARVEVAPVVSERRRRSPGERPSVVVEQLGRVAEIVYNDLRLRLVGIDVEQVPDADREVHLAKPVPQFGVDERLRPVPLSAQTAVTWLRRGELAVVGREIGRHTSELQSPCNLVCRLLLEKKKKTTSYSGERCSRGMVSRISRRRASLSLASRSFGGTSERPAGRGAVDRRSSTEIAEITS